ncbi:CBS domain-containing protein [Clostridium sediminicola]|uniref:CBS domain-containing protein n=1 Tax=Clostridium sediminicola TaxID=3114879 RepID=UPI0031F1CD84
MLVKDVMTKDVATITPEDKVDHAAELMKEYNVGSIPVCRGENVVGIVTDRDIALRSSAEGINSNTQKVQDIMSSNPVLGNPEMDTKDAARIMSERQIRRLPIANNNQLVGIVSLGDLAVEPNLTNEAGDALSDISEPCSPSI